MSSGKVYITLMLCHNDSSASYSSSFFNTSSRLHNIHTAQHPFHIPTFPHFAIITMWHNVFSHIHDITHLSSRLPSSLLMLRMMVLWWCVYINNSLRIFFIIIFILFLLFSSVYTTACRSARLPVLNSSLVTQLS